MICKRNLLQCTAAVLVSMALPLVTLLSPNTARAEETIKLYDGGWENIQVNNAIAEFLIETVFGMSVETVPSNVPDMQKQMVAGSIDVNMEMWRSLMNRWVSKVLDKGIITDLGITYESASQGFYVPTYVIQGDKGRGIKPIAPKLRSVHDLPLYVSDFVTGQNGAGYINCIPGWACRETNLVKMAAYGVSKKFHSIELSSEVELNNLIYKQYEKGVPFVTYYWDPSPMLGRLDMTLLKEPSYSKTCWSKVEAAIVEYKPGNEAEEACAYETVPISKFGTATFVAKYPQVSAMLQKMMVGTNNVRDLVGYMADKKVSPDQTAQYFFKRYPHVWKNWLTPEQVAQVTTALTN